jgi:hypothetical protein
MPITNLSLISNAYFEIKEKGNTSTTTTSNLNYTKSSNQYIRQEEIKDTNFRKEDKEFLFKML